MENLGIAAAVYAVAYATEVMFNIFMTLLMMSQPED